MGSRQLPGGGKVQQYLLLLMMTIVILINSSTPSIDEKSESVFTAQRHWAIFAPVTLLIMNALCSGDAATKFHLYLTFYHVREITIRTLQEPVMC